jgi:hypothetical protein
MHIIKSILKLIILFWASHVLLAWTSSVFNSYSVNLVNLLNLFWIFVGIYLPSVHKGKILEVLKILKSKFTRLNKSTKLLISLVLIIWIGYFIYNLIQIFLIPAINWDSMTYHLTKFANAFQTGSWWYTPDINVDRINMFGSNASILMGAFFSILGVDYLVELGQFSGALLISLLLFYISVEFFKIRKIYSFIATVSLLTIPLFLYQTITTQNDLVFTSILLISIIFVFELKKNFSRENLLFLMISLGLLIGTKHHGIIASIPILIVGLYALIVNWRKIIIKNFLPLALILPIICILAFPNNIIGYLFYNSFIPLDAGDVNKVVPGIETLWINIKHFIDWFYLRPFGDIYYFSHDIGHPGVINMLAAPFLLLSLFIFRKHINKLLFIGIVLITLTILISLRKPDDWDLRLILFFPICAVYFFTLHIISLNQKSLQRLFSVLIILIAIINLAVTFYFVQYKDLRGSLKKLLTTGEQYQIGDYYNTRYMESIIAFENDSKDKSATIILLGNNDSPLYPFYGESLQNTVVYPSTDNIQLEYLQNYNWDYLVIYHYSDESTLEVIKNLNLNYKKLVSDYYMDIYINEPTK